MSTQVMSRTANPSLADGRLAVIALLVLLSAVVMLRGIAAAPQAVPAQVAPLFPAAPRIVPFAPALERSVPPAMPQPVEPQSPGRSQPASIDSAPVEVVPATQPRQASTPVVPVGPAPGQIPVAPQQKVMTIAPEDRAPGILPPQRNVMTIAPEDGTPAALPHGASR